jgi:DNA-binding FrmR family transcriptional regulator
VGDFGSELVSARWTDTGRGYVGPTNVRPREDGAVASYTKDRDAYLKRLRRIEGQIRGLQRMVEQDQYCIDVLTQVSAATKALQSFALALLEEHMATCVVDAAADGSDASVKVKEAADAIARLVRS